MKKEIFQEIEIPEGIEVNIKEEVVEVKGPEGTISREFNFKNLDVKKKDNKIIIGHKKATKKEKKIMNSIIAHLKNMIKGVKEKFEYRLKICYSHFPFTVNIDGKKVLVKNFLGEKIPRTVEIPGGVEIKMDKEHITITSPDKEIAGRVAASFERLTKVKGRDRRVFQDGIYLINKSGKEI